MLPNPPELRLLQNSTYAQICQPADKRNSSELVNTKILREPAAEIDCPLPELLVQSQKADFEHFFGKFIHNPAARRYSFKPAYRFHLPYAELISPFYMVVSYDKYLIDDSYFNRQHLLDSGLFLPQNLQINLGKGLTQLPFTLYRPQKPSTYFSESAYLPLYYWHFNYHHWLVECLPPLIAALTQPELAQTKIVLPHSLSAFQQETLELCQLDPSRQRVFDHTAYRFAELIVPSLGNFSPLQLNQLKKFFFGRLNIQAPLPSERIYISRSDATTRQISNETEILPLLLDQGFKSYTLTGMSFSEQIQLFSRAEIIIGAHGAGLSNCIFAPSHALLVELSPNDQPNHCFWLLASALNLRYSCIFGEAIDQNRNFKIRKAELSDFLSTI